MRKILITAILSLLIKSAYNQSTQVANPFPKTISVTGSAAMEIVPDEIYVNVVIREYQKRGEDKKDIEILKTNFLANCKATGIADSAISIASYTGFNNYYQLRKKKRKDPDMFAGITYQVKFSSSKQMDDLVDKLDDEATQSFDVSYTSHSRIIEFRKLLKIQAVKAAKDKGIYLAEAIGEKLGPAITVKEPEESGNANGGNTNLMNTLSQYNSKWDGNSKSIEIDFKRIKLRYEVSVLFALQ
jgi:uncharacterized protein YggE